MVVEDTPFLADRILALSADYPEIELVTRATAGSAAMMMVAGPEPDVALVEDSLSDADAFQVCDFMYREVPGVAVILVSEIQTDAIMLLAVEAGACGVISRVTPDLDLMLAMLRAAEGEFLLPRPIVLRLFRRERELRLHLRRGGCGGDQ